MCCSLHHHQPSSKSSNFQNNFATKVNFLTGPFGDHVRKCIKSLEENLENDSSSPVIWPTSFFASNLFIQVIDVIRESLSLHQYICNEPSEPIKQSPLLTDEDRNTSTEANVKAKHVFWKIKIDYDGMHGICNIQQIFCWWLLVNNQYYWLMSWKRGLWLVVWVNTRCFLSRLSLNQHMTLVMVTRSHGYPELWSCENCEDVKETAEYMLY